MAAGSRQQSRFLALMQDWGRTTELVNMANNAEGSGQEQFEKTLDSLTVKITNLKNAWDTFIMGLANNSIITGVVDTIKTIIDGINKAIDVISGGNGIVKSLASLGAAFAIFKIGKTLFNSFLGNIG
jgi:deoxyhypusine synthase